MQRSHEAQIKFKSHLGNATKKRLGKGIDRFSGCYRLRPRGTQIVSQSKTDPTAVVWSVTLGWNHAEDTLECLASLKASRGVSLRLLYVDNGSHEDQVQQILDNEPDVEVIRHPKNVGVARGFNAGLAWALRKGADFIFMANNDTLMQPETVLRLLEEADRSPRAGLLVPKIYYHEAPEVLWSAGSRFRFFPPAIVMNKTTGPDDGRYDGFRELKFSTLCTVLVRAEAMKAIGLIDPNFVFYFEDYEFCLRMRDSGWRIRLVPEARTVHKVARITRDAPSKPSFWETSGRGAAIFHKRHGRRHPWMAGWPMLIYLAIRARLEGGPEAYRFFCKGLREGHGMALQPVPPWTGDGCDPIVVVRERYAKEGG